MTAHCTVGLTVLKRFHFFWGSQPACGKQSSASLWEFDARACACTLWLQISNTRWAQCSMNGFVVMKFSLIENWLLTKSENIGKKWFSLPCSVVILFIQTETGSSSQLKMEIRYIAIKNALTARRFHAVSVSDVSKLVKSIGKGIDVKVSPILFKKVSVLVSAILSVQSVGIVIGNTFCKYR